MSEIQHIAVVGAGLCGGLLALRLAQRGYKVSLYEMRDDMRKHEVDAGRSINLALSDRGLRALRLAGMEERMRSECIPMHGRMIHPTEGLNRLSPYSGRKSDFINSVSRSDLNRILLEEADRHEQVALHFNAKCKRVDFDKMEIVFDQGGDELHIDADLIIGTDGAGSRVRRELLAYLDDDAKQNESVFLTHGYKELSIPPKENGEWRIEKNALHIWPRGTFMLIALPNLDGSFTVTLFLSHEGEDSFQRLESDDHILSFFKKYFPDVLPHMPELIKDYRDNPIGKLGTLKCFPWHLDKRALLLGDAAHAIVPFYGQGMNASFEDVVVLDQCIEDCDGDWSKVGQLYEQRRKIDTDAIADLALDNFYEMRDHVDDKVFVEKRKIEMKLEQTFADYYSKYSMVTFDENMPYSVAMMKGRKQDQILLDLCKSDRIQDLTLEQIKAIVQSNAK